MKKKYYFPLCASIITCTNGNSIRASHRNTCRKDVAPARVLLLRFIESLELMLLSISMEAERETQSENIIVGHRPYKTVYNSHIALHLRRG